MGNATNVSKSQAEIADTLAEAQGAAEPELYVMCLEERK